MTDPTPPETDDREQEPENCAYCGNEEICVVVFRGQPYCDAYCAGKVALDWVDDGTSNRPAAELLVAAEILRCLADDLDSRAARVTGRSPLKPIATEVRQPVGFAEFMAGRGEES